MNTFFQKYNLKNNRTVFFYTYQKTTYSCFILKRGEADTYTQRAENRTEWYSGKKQGALSLVLPLFNCVNLDKSLNSWVSVYKPIK